MSCKLHLFQVFYAVNLASSVISLVASILVLIVYIYGPKKETISRLICYLTISDLGASLSIVVSQVTLMLGVYDFIECVIYRCLIQFFFIASFLWTCCIAHHLYRETKLLTKIANPALTVYHCISWGVSAVVVIVLVANNKIVPSTQSWCHLDPMYEIVLWIVPITLAIAWNTLFYILIIRRIFWVFQKKVVGSIDNGSLIKQEAIKKLSLLLLVFILCWAPDMFNHIAEYFFGSCAPDWAVVLQDLLGPLQGFLNSWVYGYSNNEFKETSRMLFNRCRGRGKKDSPTLAESLSLINTQ